MSDYLAFCEHYRLDPESEGARLEYAEAVAALQALYGASAEAEAREAIDKAKQH